MKKMLILLGLTLSTASFATTGSVCNPGKKVLEKAALSLARINQPEAELSVKLAPATSLKSFTVVVDDNYGLYDVVITTEESSNGFCRIKSITEL